MVDEKTKQLYDEAAKLNLQALIGKVATINGEVDGFISVYKESEKYNNFTIQVNGEKYNTFNKPIVISDDFIKQGDTVKVYYRPKAYVANGEIHKTTELLAVLKLESKKPVKASKSNFDALDADSLDLSF